MKPDDLIDQPSNFIHRLIYCLANPMAEAELILSLTTIPFLVVGFIGNVLVIRIVHKTRDMHTPTNYLLANMAVSDVITIFLVPASKFANHLEYQSDGFRTFICKTFGLIAICVTVSSITLTVLAVERYHALLKPFRTGLRLKEDNITYALVFIWISSVIIGFPAFIFKDWSERYSTCVGPWTLHMNQTDKVYLLIIATFIYIKLVAVSFCYGALIRGIYFTKTVCAGRAGERNEERTQLVVTFILATVGFFIGNAPVVVFFTILASQSDELLDSKLNSVLLSVFVVVLHCSLCFNPILYAFRSTNFKVGFKRMLPCREPMPSNEIELR